MQRILFKWFGLLRKSAAVESLQVESLSPTFKGEAENRCFLSISKRTCTAATSAEHFLVMTYCFQTHFSKHGVCRKKLCQFNPSLLKMHLLSRLTVGSEAHKQY